MDDDYKYWKIRKKPVLIVLGVLFLIWFWLIVNSANYVDYSIRTKVSELMVVSTVIKEKISEEIIESQSETIRANMFGGEWPTNASEFLNYSFITDRGKKISIQRKTWGIVNLYAYFGTR